MWRHRFMTKRKSIFASLLVVFVLIASVFIAPSIFSLPKTVSNDSMSIIEESSKSNDGASDPLDLPCSFEASFTKQIQSERAGIWLETAQASVNETVQFQIILNNTGADPFTLNSITDTIPSIVSFNTGSQKFIGPTNITYNFEISDSTLYWNFTSGGYWLQPEDEIHITYTSTAITAGTADDTAVATACECNGTPETASGSTSLLVTTSVPPDNELFLEKYVSAGSVGGITTLIDEGFEGSFPPAGWTNTGWLRNQYGEAHEGTGWIYSWGAGDTLTTPTLTFGDDTELRFWYAAEDSGHSMDLEVYIDDTLLWSDYGYTHETYTEEIIDLSAYTGDHSISFVAMTSDFYGQMIDDILVTTTLGSSPVWLNGITIDSDECDVLSFKIDVDINGQFDTLTIHDKLPSILSYQTGSWEILGDSSSFEDFTQQGKDLFWKFSAITDESFSILFRSDVTGCGDSENIVDAKAFNVSQGYVYENDAVSVDINCILEPISVEKQIWNGAAWSDFAEVDLGDTVHFKVIICNPYEEYSVEFSGVVYDVLPDNLRYINGSSTIYEVDDGDDWPNLEDVDWENNTVYWVKPPTISPEDCLVFTYEALAVDCGIGTNNLTVHPDSLIPVDDPDNPIINEDNAFDVSDDATVDVICEDHPDISVKKYSATDSHSNYNDTIPTDVPSTSYPKYKVIVTNTGDVTLDTVTVTDTLPDGFTYDHMVTGSAPLVDGQMLTWTLSDIEPGDSYTLIFTADLPVDVDCVIFENQVDVVGESEGYDDVDASDSAWVDIVCDDNPDISVKKYSATDSHSNYNDTIPTDVPSTSYPKYKVIVTNTGDVTFDEVTVVDTLPVGFTFKQMISGPSPSITGRILRWTFTNKEPGWSQTLIFTANLPVDVSCSIFENIVDVTGSIVEDGTVHDTDSAWINILCEPDEPDGDFFIHKLVKPDCQDALFTDNLTINYMDYDYVTYRLEVLTNNSLLSLSVKDTIPQFAGLEFDATYVKDEMGYFVDSSEYTFEMNAEYLFWNFSYLPAHTHYFIYYCANIVGCGDFENTANATGFYYENGPCCPTYLFDEDSAVIDIICPSGVSLEKEVSLDGVTWDDTGVETFIGDTIWFKLTIKNLGFDTVYGINVIDYLPDFLRFEEVISDGDADLFEDHHGWLRWFYQSIDDTVVILFKATVINIGEDVNLACVSGCDEGEWCDSVLIEVSEGMFVGKQVSLDKNTWVENLTLNGATSVWWNVTVSYYSSIETLTLYRLLFEDILPEGVTYVPGSATFLKNNGWTLSKNPQIQNNKLTWNLADITGAALTNGTWLSLTFKTTVNANADGILVNWVNVTGWQCDDTVVLGRDSATISTTSTCLMDCEKLVRKDSTDPWVDEIDAGIGDTVSFNITLQNMGDMPMYHIGVWDVLPTKLEYIDGTSKLYANGSYMNCEPDELAGNILLWTDLCECIPSNDGADAEYLMQGEKISLVYSVEIVGTGIAINRADINATMCYQGVHVECSDTATVNISIPPLVADAGPSKTGFINDVIELTASATGGLLPYTFYWDLDNDGDYDDATGQTVEKTWTIVGTYTIGLKVVDDRGKNDTDTTQVTIKTRTANLACYGSLNWVDISPGDTITGEFTVRNTGDPQSKLDWEIQSMPDWGTWSCSPSSGTDLTPEEGSVTVTVTVDVPRKRNEQYYGNLSIINTENPSDSCQVSISLATPKPWNNHPLYDFIENLLAHFPSLQWIFDTLFH
jgi:uncharacterized repeat protein (TIGR01451 family)/fimbrial isopeptide formation D2 family protein